MDDKKLTLEELNYVQREVLKNTKNSTKAYLFAIFLGPLGIHRAYFGKKKTAILQVLVTLFLAMTLALIALKMSQLDPDTEITRTMMTSNAALAISFLGLSSTCLIWYFVDLFLIPSWKRKWDAKNDETATHDVIQGRYVKTQLLREQLSEELVESAKIDAVDTVREMILKLNADELHTLNAPSIPKFPESEDDENVKDDEKVVEQVEVNSEEILQDDKSTEHAR